MFSRNQFFQSVSGARDDMLGNKFTDSLSRCCSGFNGGTYRRGIADDFYRDERAAGDFLANENDIGGFHHGVGRFNGGNKSFGFY